MKLNDINKFRTHTGRTVRRGHLLQAIADIREAFPEGLPWDEAQRLDAAEATYRALLSYLANGAADPRRHQVYDDLVAEVLSIADAVARAAAVPTHPAQYYATLRTRAMNPADTIPALARRHEVEMRRLNADFDSIADSRRTKTAEALARDFFDAVWTSYPLAQPDIDALNAVLARQAAIAGPLPLLAVSAVTMGLMEFYDPARLVWLLDTYASSPTTAVGARALVGAMLAMFRFRSRPLGQAEKAALDRARAVPSWNQDYAMIVIFLMNATNTENVIRMMQRDIMPGLQKMASDIKDRIDTGEIHPDSLLDAENPEWESITPDDKTTGTLKALIDLQSSGADTMMATFGNMKGFALFNHPSGWFMPFYDTYSDVAAIDDASGILGRLVNNMLMLCDSDKYSAALVHGSLPAQQREAMLKMIEENQQSLKRSNRDNRDLLFRHYISDIYRFYKSYRLKNQFFDPFAHTPWLLGVGALEGSLTDAAQVEAVANFMFDHRMWPQAVDAFRLLDTLSEPDAKRAQKIGYALEKSDRLDEAIAAYEEAEVLDGGASWTLRHMGRCLQELGHHQRAVGYYARLSQLAETDPSVAFDYASALLAAERPAEAEPIFHKAVYLDPDSVAPLRGLGMAQLLTGKAEQAVKVFGTVISRGAGGGDYILLGHALRARGDVAQAIAMYKLADPDIDVVAKRLEADDDLLQRAGIDTSDTTLIIEAMINSMTKH